MAADHLKKRPNTAGSIALGHNRPKKKKLDSINSNLNSKSHVSLEWDDLQSKVIAKKYQISLSKRAKKPFGTSGALKSNELADVLSTPSDLFGLKNLNGILSYEVWDNKLSEKDRKLLSNFLPQNSDHNEILEALFSGENFHFGNPFMQWSSKLCSGSLHPDTVHIEEENLKEHKRKHYSDVQKYHTNMIKYLQKLKKTWQRSKDADFSKTTVKFKNCLRNGDCIDDTAATSYSSWVEEDKAGSSDNQVTQQRVKELHTKVGCDKNRAGQDFSSTESSVYMSYIKISKKQFNLINSMKHSGKSIQSKSLKSILGAVDPGRIHPYEDFGKEQLKKFQENWLRLVHFDIPSTYAKRKNRQQQKNELILLLCQELTSNPPDEKQDNVDAGTQNTVETSSNTRDNVQDVDSENMESDRNPEITKGEENDNRSLCKLNTENRESSIEEYEEATSASNAEERHSSHSDGHASNNLEATKNMIPPTNDYSANAKNLNSSLGTVFPFSAPSDMFLSSNSSICHNPTEMSESCVYSNVGFPSSRMIFPEVNNTDSSVRAFPIDNVGPESYLYHNSAVKGYPSFTGSEIEEDARKRILQRQSQDNSFPVYSNPDRSGLLQSLFSRQDLPFQPANNMIMQDGVFNGNLHQVMAAEQGKKMRVENFIAQSSSGELYTESGGYPVTRHVSLPQAMGSHFPQDPPPVLAQKWLCDGVSADQSLYSVLSQCTQMRSDRALDCGDSSEQMILPTNYTVMGPRIGNNAVARGHHPLEFLGGRDTGTSIDSGWVNLPQSSSTHDPLEKPFLRTWNQ